VLTIIGNSLGHTYQNVVHNFSDAGYVIAALAVLAVAFVLFHRIRAVRAQGQTSSQG
jgi:hypothetical protein